jgi:DNA polymerase-3 subunit beta
MKFTVPSSELLKKLQTANGAISSNPVLPILEDFLFTLSDGELIITATDLETFTTTRIEVMGADKDGSVAVPAKILLDTLKKLPAQPVTFVINEETFGIEIKSAYGKYRLAGENGQDFPNVPHTDEVDAITMNTAQLIQGINKTIFATSSDDLRPQMTGVNFEVGLNNLVLVATDAHKLVKYTFSEVTSNVATSFIVPKKALNLLKNALSTADTVKVAFNRANAFFTFGSNHIVCRLIDARFPDYNAVIPTNNPNTLLVTRADFQHSLERIAIYANKTTNQVVLDLTENSLTISAQDLDFSNEATEQLACDYAGDALRIAFNAKFMVEMLNAMDAENIRMELSSPNRAAIIKPLQYHRDKEDLLMLVMPVMLNY